MKQLCCLSCHLTSSACALPAEPILAPVVGYSEHGDAYRCISYLHEGKTVLPLYSFIL